jgi:hypothetical protein
MESHSEMGRSTHWYMWHYLNHYAKWKKPDQRVHTLQLYYIILHKILENASLSLMTESKPMVIWRGGSGQRDEL